MVHMTRNKSILYAVFLSVHNIIPRSTLKTGSDLTFTCWCSNLSPIPDLFIYFIEQYFFYFLIDF